MASSAALRPCLGRLLLDSHVRLLPTRPPPICLLGSHASSLAGLSPTPTRTAAAPFSTSAPRCKRRPRRRDMNRQRGVSSIYRSGPREPLSVSGEPLPIPARNPRPIKVDDDHALWGFFHAPHKLMNTPDEDLAFGRAWTAEELRRKDWNDLHALWWVCVKERNRISTADAERARGEFGFGDYEASKRDEAVQTTMRRIKHVLLERQYVWEDARKAAKNDPEIDLSGQGPAYTPQSFESDEYIEEEAARVLGEAEKSIPKP